MRTSHAFGLLMGTASIIGSVAAFAAGCGSSQRSSIIDDGTGGGGDDGGSGTFGPGDGGPTKACTGLQCQQKTCSGGLTTTVTGKVYAPNGTLPLYNAIVYVPNSEPSALTKGATCDKCGAVTGDPIVTALTDPEGKFELKDVPVGKDIPIVVQIGKWRRQVKLPEVKECTENALVDKELTRLPKSQAEGDMPQIALTTGQCESFGCMLPKIGIAPTEFGNETDGTNKSVHVYLGNGQGPSGASQAANFWNDPAKLKKYDMVILSCECSENLGNKGGANGPAFSAMQEYLEAGGRIFSTDYQYTWYRYSPNADMRATINGRWNAPLGGSSLKIDTTFPKGQALADWLQKSAGLASGTTVTPSTVFGNFISNDTAKSQQWATSNTAVEPRVVSVNVPVGLPADQQCGKGVHLDAHVNTNDTVGTSYPGGCGTSLREGENLLAFFFFDLASCIQAEGEPPKPPPVK